MLVGLSVPVSYVPAIQECRAGSYRPDGLTGKLCGRWEPALRIAWEISLAAESMFHTVSLPDGCTMDALSLM